MNIKLALALLTLAYGLISTLLFVLLDWRRRARRSVVWRAGAGFTTIGALIAVILYLIFI